MHPAYDKYAHLPSVINQWDNRVKLVAFILLSFSFAFADNFYSISAMIAITLIVAVLSRLNAGMLLKKLKAPLFFFLFILIVLPLYPAGEPLFKSQYLGIYKNGLLKAVKIILRASCIITVLSVMLESSSFDKMVRSMRSLKVPDFFTSLILFTQRYIYLYRYRIRKMRFALKLRGYKNKAGKHSFKAVAGITANVIIQSYEQSERVAQSMILRGFNGNMTINRDEPVTYPDIFKLFLFVVFTSVIIVTGVIF